MSLPPPGQLSAEEQQLIADVSRDVVAQLAPHEMPVFRPVSQAFFQQPERALAQAGDGDQMLGFGAGEVVQLLTPVVLAVATEVLLFVAQEAKKTARTEGVELANAWITGAFRRLRPPTGAADQPAASAATGTPPPATIPSPSTPASPAPSDPALPATPFAGPASPSPSSPASPSPTAPPPPASASAAPASPGSTPPAPTSPAAPAPTPTSPGSAGLPREQLARIREVAYNAAVALKVAPDQAQLLASAMVGDLVVAA